MQMQTLVDKWQLMLAQCAVASTASSGKEKKHLVLYLMKYE